jgi:NAD(P)-binding Rossmann-like domain
MLLSSSKSYPGSSLKHLVEGKQIQYDEKRVHNRYLSSLLPFFSVLLTCAGAGPSGLVAAKTLMHDAPIGSFHVTVFEQSSRIGGLWPISKVDFGIVNPDMCVNQSRHTVSFSDFAWEEGKASFPKAWEVGEYLEKYRERYEVKVSLGSKVVGTEMLGERWRVRVDGEVNDKRVCTAAFPVHSSLNLQNLAEAIIRPTILIT